MDIDDKAHSTLTILRNATWLNSDQEIEDACKQVAEYLKLEHLEFSDNDGTTQKQKGLDLYNNGYNAGWDMAVDANNNGQHIEKGGPKTN